MSVFRAEAHGPAFRYLPAHPSAIFRGKLTAHIVGRFGHAIDPVSYTS